jgi:hypothetical protein
MTPTIDPTFADQPVEQAAAPTQQAAPPITTRNTYPAGQPTLGGPPKPLLKTPTSVSQIMFPISGVQGTLYQGPLISGPTPGVAGAAGTAILTLALQIDWTMGNFNLPIQFPGGSFIMSLSAVTYAAGLAGVIANFGSQSGAVDIGKVTIPPAGTVLAPAPPDAQLPLWDKTCPTCPFQAWLGVTGNTGNTSGGTIVLVQYVRLASPWSSPATKLS